MRIFELISKPINETATSGATASGAVATSLGGSAGFGKSIFMRRTPVLNKKKSKK